MHWNRLNRDVVDASSLETFRTKLRWGFEQPGLNEHIPAYVGEIGMTFKAPSNPAHPMIP